MRPRARQATENVIPRQKKSARGRHQARGARARGLTPRAWLNKRML